MTKANTDPGFLQYGFGNWWQQIDRLMGRMWLYCVSHWLMAIWAYFVVVNHSASRKRRLQHQAAAA